jgi:large subunit ribosomal protein L35
VLDLTEPRFPIIFRAPGLQNDASSGASARADERAKVATMPKMKTNKAAAKRFRITGKGRVRRPKAGGNHGMQEKSRKRLRRLRKNDMVHTTMEKHVKRLLPYG